MWQNSHLSDIHTNLCAPENSGWFLKEDGSYEIDWEDPKKQDQL